MRHLFPFVRRRLSQTIAATCVMVSWAALAQTADSPLPVTAEPNHRIRFDNGFVRMYEVELPRGKTTAFHEHRADNFQVFFATTTVAGETKDGQLRSASVKAGQVAFSSTEKGPYTHRVEGGGDVPFHVIAMELLSKSPETAAGTAPKRSEPPFAVAQENMRGRAYKVVLAPGETSPMFTRPAHTAIFAITGGRTRETAEGKPSRLWDFDPANFRWTETTERLTVKNESQGPVELVEIEVF